MNPKLRQIIHNRSRRFVVIEGLDGSGKSTQVKLLTEYLDRIGMRYKFLHFPRLEEGVYGRLIARFLRGEMGAIDRVDPYLVALIFAGDRAAAAPLIRLWMEEENLVIVDRYVYSNIAFQCAKLGSAAEREQLRNWILELEYGTNQLPRPDLNLFLDVPFEFTRRQLERSRDGDDRAYLKGERDIHEEDIEFQEKVRREYLSLQQSCDDLLLLDCSGDKRGMLTAGEISERIIKQLETEA